MPKCTAMTLAGNPCKNNAATGSTTCRKHMPAPAAVEPQCRCQSMTTKGTQCKKYKGTTIVSGAWYCGRHLMNFQTANARVFDDRIDDIAEIQDLAAFEQAIETLIDELFMAYDANRIHHTDMFAMRGELIHMLEDGPRAPLPQQAVYNLALDPQNVHTAVVVEQTNRGVDLLLAQPDVDCIESVYDAIHLSRSVARDIEHWYNLASCKEQNDWLYRRALNGLWGLIEASPHKAELLVRFQQEATESVGMCCEGHMGRLANVMVGFDDRFAPPVAAGEVLQQRMAAIAAREGPLETKLADALAVLTELHVPQDQHAAWLEAF